MLFFCYDLIRNITFRCENGSYKIKKQTDQPTPSLGIIHFFHQQCLKHKEGFMLLSWLRLFETAWTVSSPGSSVHGDSLGNNTRVGCHSLFQGIFPIQELNLGLLLCRQILYVWASREVPKEGLVLRHSFQFNSSYMDYIPIRWKTCYKLRMNLKINLQPEVLDLEHFQNSCNFSMGYVRKKKKKNHLLHINVTTTFNKSKYPPIPVFIPHIYHLHSVNTTMTPFRK